ncbi:MAG: class I SAM-dependent methyltransferase [Dehalococcoidia bacterium]
MVTAEAAIDEAKAEAFAGQMIGLVNGSMLGLQISIGHQVGLFDKMAELPPSTSQEIADATNLNERYVREWLGSMTTGRLVDYDPPSGKYSLAPEHAGFLTRAAGPNNLAAMFQFLPEMGRVEEKIIACFRNGGGVGYDAYPRFVELMREESAAVVDATLVDVTLPLVAGLPEKLELGIDVADVGCGAGHAINLMAKTYPNSRFAGYDFSDEALGVARAEAEEWGLKNAKFEARDAANLGINEQVDLVTTFDSVHDQAHPAEMLASLYAALKPGGDYLCVDIAASSKLEENMEHPLAPMLYTISTLHCMTVSLAYDGVGLGTVWGEQKALEMMTDAGFTGIEVKRVEGDILNNYYVAHKP